MRKDLMVLEYELQGMKIDERVTCIDTQERKYKILQKKLSNGELSSRDVKANDPRYKCRTKSDLGEIYNTAVAKLVLAEGINSITMSIEGNNNALSDISIAQIENGMDYIQEMEQSLVKADILEKAIDVSINETGRTQGNGTIFKRYASDNWEDLAEYLDTKCSADEFYKKSDFCKTLNKANKENFDGYQDSIKAMQGMLSAVDQISSKEKALQQELKKVQKRLYLKLDDQNLSPSQFQNSEHYKNILALKKELEILRSEKISGKQNSDNIKKVVTLANKLSKIKASFNSSANVGSADMPEFINTNFDAIISGFNLPGTLLQGGIKDNFENSIKRIRNGIKLQSKSNEKEILSFLNKNKETRFNGKTLLSHCANNLSVSCLERLCGKTPSQLPDKCYNLNKAGILGLSEAYERLQRNNSQVQMENLLLRGKLCLEDTESYKTLRAQKNCLAKVQQEYSVDSDLKSLKDDVEIAQKNINTLNNDTPKIKELNIRKGIALEGLNTSYCRKRGDLKIFKGLNSDCNSSNKLVPDYTVLDLGLNGEQVMIELNYSQLDQYLKKSGSDGALNTPFLSKSRKRFKEDCKTNNNQMKTLCDFYTSNETWAAAVEEDRIAKENGIFIKPEIYEEPNWLWEGTTEFAKGFATQIPNLAMTWIQYDTVKTNSEFQINSINNYNSNYMTTLAYQRDYINNFDSNPFFAQNFGVGFQGLGYNDLSTFQFNNTSTLYSRGRQSSPTNFNFTGIPTTIATRPGGIGTFI